MKKIKKLKLGAETIRPLNNAEAKRAAGGVTLQCTAQPTFGYTVCICLTDYPNSCPCQDTARCEPSYRIC